MKLQRLFLSALVGLPLLALGRPAYPGVLTVSNPDGTTMQVRAYGDEKFNYYTDVDGLKIMETGKDGFWRQAVRMDRMLTPVEKDINLLKAERLAVEPTAVQAVHKMALLDDNGRTTYPTVSTEPIHALVVLLEFAESPFSMADPVQQFSRMLNEEGYSDYMGCGSARDYFMASSNGKFNVVFDVTRVVRLKYNSRWYTGVDLNPLNRQARFGTAIQEALKELDDEVDFSKYDLDGDGYIDNIFFFYSGFGQADTGNDSYIWPHQGSYYNFTYYYPEANPTLVVDGVYMRTYACANELNGMPPTGAVQPFMDGIGGFCHEYGHVLGLPDMYDTQKQNTITPGYYTIMDKGSYSNYSTCPPLFSSYEQWLCRWIEPTILTEGESVTLPSMSNTNDPQCALIRVQRLSPPNNPRYYNEWYFIETRTKDGWDTYQPDFGLMVWHVNYEKKDLWGNNTVNSTGTPYIQLLPSATRQYVWPGKDNVVFSTPDSSNAFPVHNNQNPNFKIYFTDIAFDEEAKEASFSFNRVTEAPTDVTVLHANPRLATEDANCREFYLDWDEVPGANGYQVTVIRTDSRGTERFVDELNEKNVGNITSLLVSNMSETAWKQDYKAYVRVISGIPSSKTSNTITFRTDELAYSNGVEDIASDTSFIAIGGKGYINAPAGAKVYNMAGVATGADNLPAGVYIVRLGDKIRKVVVF